MDANPSFALLSSAALEEMVFFCPFPMISSSSPQSTWPLVCMDPGKLYSVWNLGN